MARSESLDDALKGLKANRAIIAAAERISNFGTFLHDPKADEAVWSLQLKRMFGFPEDDQPVKLTSFLARVHPNDLPVLNPVFNSLKRVGDRNEHSYRIVLPDGSERHIEASAELVRVDGFDHPVLVGTAIDRTDQVEARRLITEQAEALEAAQAELLYHSRQSAMGTMAATLAHELNQPLAAITFTIAAARRMASGTCDHIDEMLRDAQESALRAGEIIRRLRQSLQTGQPRRERFTSKDVIEESIRFSSLGCEGVRFELDLEEDQIDGADRVQIQQVLVNLIRNACQAMACHPEPVIGITARTLPPPASLLRVSVEDNGPGIPEHLLPRLFQRGVTTKETGMGLGLAIAKTIIEAHGGRLWAENKASGACVAFEIPLKGDTAASDKAGN